MNYLINFFRELQRVTKIDGKMVERLYALSQRSLIALLAFIAVVTYFLYPSLERNIVIWAFVMTGIAFVRLITVYLFRYRKMRISSKGWYWTFLALNFLTASIVSLVGGVFIFDVDNAQKLFIVAALVGLTGGATSSLLPDIRMLMGYTTIILLPLAVSLFSLGEQLYIVLSGMLVLYFLTQMTIAYNLHRQNVDLARHQEEVIRAQEQLFKERETLEYFYTQAPIGIFSYDLNLRVTECNDAFLELFHLRREEIIGMNLNLLPDRSPLRIIKAALTEGVQDYIGPYFSTKGLEYWVEAKSFPIHNSENEVIGGIVLLENKTNEHRAVERLKYLASHDALTQLSNRRGFQSYMEKMIADKRHERYASLLFYLDLDRFKHINDSLGHSFGDKLLQAVAERLRSIVPERSNLTRLGGDEFVIVLPFVSEDVEKVKAEAKSFSETIRNAFEEPFVLEGVRLYVKTSIGIVLIEPNFTNVEEIVRHADISMYQAKKQGQEHISFYNNTLDEERKKVFALQQDLIHALENDGFELYLQPIVNIDDNRINAAEALIRWRHPQRGLLQPTDFIPLAIELGVITEIGWWVLKHVCETISKWKEKGIWRLEYISININAKQLIKENFVEEFFSVLERYDIQMQDIKIEITETSLIDNFELTQQVIHELQKRGIKCVIDDFGTGYSSLSYLKKLSFSVLKIDREFIFDLENDHANETLIRTIIAIAKQFNYKIVVEGIEKEEQREIIKSIDEELSYQGFLISEPLPMEEFAEKFIVKGISA